MLDVLTTTFDMQHILHPFDKDATGHKSVMDKLAGGTVIVVGGLATLGILPTFYLVTAYRKTHYWNHIADRLQTLNTVQSSTTAKQTQKTKAVAEKRFIQLHLLKQLHANLATDSFEELKSQIEKNHFDLNTVDDKGYSLFHYVIQYEFEQRAAEFNNPRTADNMKEVLKLLEYLENQPQTHLNAKTKNGLTPLLLAVEYNLQQTFFALIKNKNLDVNARNQEYLTPLQQLVKEPTSSTAEMVKALVAHPQFNLSENAQQPPKYHALLSTACRSYQADLIAVLLALPGVEFINQPNPDHVPVISHLLNFFESTQNFAGLSQLIDKPEINYGNMENNGSLLHYAIKQDKTGCIKALLKDMRVDVNAPNKWGRTPLDLVAEGSDIQKLLLERGAVKSQI